MKPIKKTKVFKGSDKMVYLFTDHVQMGIDYQKILPSFFFQKHSRKSKHVPNLTFSSWGGRWRLPEIEQVNSIKLSEKTFDLFKMPFYYIPTADEDGDGWYYQRDSESQYLLESHFGSMRNAINAFNNDNIKETKLDK